MTTDDPRGEFTRAMRGWAASVTLVSARTDSGERQAMTATSFVSASMEPPTVLVCVNTGAAIYPTLQAGNPFCINLLHAGQRRLSELCSQPGDEESRFAQGDWQDREVSAGAGGQVPWLADAQSNIFCTHLHSWQVGSHSLFAGAVQWVRAGSKRDPLLYLDGDYRRPGAEVEV